MKVKIIADSTCDLSRELIDKYDIAITPLSVILGEKTGLDGIEITPEDIYAHVEATGQLPKTSAINTEEYRRVFRHWQDEGCQIVQFCISSLFSSCYQNACTAAEGMQNVYVVDTLNLSTGMGLLVLHAAEMAQKGCSASEIHQACTKLTAQVEASFVVNSIDYLYKGGRCSALSALGANLLRIKPCIEVTDGRMVPGHKLRGNIGKVMQSYVEERLAGRKDIDLHRIFITHTQCDPADVEAVRQKILQLQPGFEEILETTAGSTITSHCGPATLGVLFIRKEDA